MNKLTNLFLGFLVLFTIEESPAEDLMGKIILSGMGGTSYIMQAGFSSENKIKNNYSFGMSFEYFFLNPLSLGLTVAHNSFQGEWYRTGGYFSPGISYSTTDWNWTNIGIFTKFVLGPENKAAPYFKGGLGWYYPRIKDWLYYPPNTGLYPYSPWEMAIRLVFRIRNSLSDNQEDSLLFGFPLNLY